MAKNKRNPTGKEVVKYLLENYDIKSTLDIQEALKDMFSETIQAMLNTELDSHLGYEKSENKVALTTNRRNGFTRKTVHSQLGKFSLSVPRDRDTSFEPMVVQKR